MDVKASRPVTISEAKEILAKRKKENELGYEQNQALDHAERFAALDEDKAKKLVDTLKKKDKISEELAAKLVDTRPETPATVRAILAKDKVELSEEEIAHILKELA